MLICLAICIANHVLMEEGQNVSPSRFSNGAGVSGGGAEAIPVPAEVNNAAL